MYTSINDKVFPFVVKISNSDNSTAELICRKYNHYDDSMEIKSKI